MRFLAALAALFAGVFLLVSRHAGSPGVEAGTALRMDVPELARRAALIVEARVLDAHAVQEPGGRIETEYLLDVQRTLAGEDLPTRTVRLPGGVLPDGRGMMLAGMPRLDVGERALLFLTEATPGGMRMPVGLAQGKMRVSLLPSGEKVLVREQAGLSLARPGAGVREAESFAVLDYAEVLAQVEAARAGLPSGDRR